MLLFMRMLFSGGQLSTIWYGFRTQNFMVGWISRGLLRLVASRFLANQNLQTDAFFLATKREI